MEEDNAMRIVTITDNVLCTTGFANVARVLLQGFHDAGHLVYSFGTMDTLIDHDGKLPYFHWPVYSKPAAEAGRFIANIKPDLVFMLYDPATLSAWADVVKEVGNRPIVAYMPIEGFPIPVSTARTMLKIAGTGGINVLYSPRMVELVDKCFGYQVPQYALSYAYHGSDHALFEPIEPERREDLRRVAVWRDDFVVGAFGTNKRTKNFDQYIYLARHLRDKGVDEGIKFYLHTNADHPTMGGYDLKDLALTYGVFDMFIWKPEVEREEGGNVRGISRDTIGKPTGLEQIGYVDRLRMCDCVLDLSSMEGWGLPAFEAMACEVPVISVDDSMIREEIYQDGAYLMKPIEFRLWPTLHTGARLPIVDVETMAEAVLTVKNEPAFAIELAKRGGEIAWSYKWQDAIDVFLGLFDRVLALKSTVMPSPLDATPVQKSSIEVDYVG